METSYNAVLRPDRLLDVNAILKVKVVFKEAGPFNTKPLGIACPVVFERGASFAEVEITETKKSKTRNTSIVHETATQCRFLERCKIVKSPMYLYAKDRLYRTF